MGESKEMLAENQISYEWDDEKIHLIRKLDRAIVAEIFKSKNKWSAKDTSGTTNRKIGDFENLEAARKAVEEKFGLRLAKE